MVLQPIILSGGSGTRLWPLSREKYPKQLLNLFNDKSMLQNTALRLNNLDIPNTTINEPIVISNREYRFLIAEQLTQSGITPNIVLEPCGRNTAPALTVAALKSMDISDDAVLLVMPADHLIEEVTLFQKAIISGYELARDNGIVCFGITPTYPETGYGYINFNKDQLPHQLFQFVEKPDHIKAKSYLESGEYVWNSGIFMLRSSVWIEAISNLQPEIYSACLAAYKSATIDHDFTWIHEEEFKKSPENSIDFAVMEKIGILKKSKFKSYVVPLDVGWSDVGAWDAVWGVSSKDKYGNATNENKNVKFLNSESSYVYNSSKRLISLVGLENIVVIDTQDALLIANKNKLVDLKELVCDVKKTHYSLTQLGRQVYRPWGHYDQVDKGERFQVKRIVVKPGQSLSLQMHYHRAEHWIVVKGTGRITRDNEIVILHENQSIYIPVGVKHRLENPGKVALEIIEVQSGHYLGEDDIVRFEDIYGRTK